MQQRDRIQVLDTLAAMEAELSQISIWLDREDQERAAVLCQEAWRSLLAAQMLIDRDAERVRGLVPRGPLADGGRLRPVLGELRRCGLCDVSRQLI